MNRPTNSVERTMTVGVRANALRGQLSGALRKLFGPLRQFESAPPGSRFGASDASIRRAQQPAELPFILCHELRTPLACARHVARLLAQTGPDEASHGRMLAMLDRQLVHMSRLIEDLLESTRVAEGTPVPIRPSRINLRKLLYHTIEAHAHAVTARQQSLSFAMAGEPVWLRADADRLAQVFGNLLANAIKYTGPGGTIAVWMHLRQRSVVVRIRDSGIGIEPAELPRIFDRYRQAAPVAPYQKGDGFGIGLAVVQDLVRLHGGSVTASSGGLGRGSEFAVCLPLDDGAVE